MKKSIDGRTLPCPQPVIKVKQAFDKGDFHELEVLVDNRAAVENITRFVENSGNSILSVTEDEELSTIIIQNNRSSGVEKEEQPAETGELKKSGDTSIFINSSTIGSGEKKLGEKLMEAFIFALTETDVKPANILIMNSGVQVTVEGSPSIENLRELENSGVTILVCGACLDFYGIKDRLMVGKISNMYEITTLLLASGNTVTVG